MTINAVNRSISVLPSADGIRHSSHPAGDYTTIGTLLFSADFEDGLTDPGADWTAGTVTGGTLTVSTDTALTYNGSAGSIRGQYPYPANDSHCYLTLNGIGALDLSEVYIEFRAKMPSAYKGGLKFCKIFGQNDGTYANATYALDFTGIEDGAFLGMGYGDGTTTTNDAQCVLFFDSARTSIPGRASSPTILRPADADWSASNWGTTWHRFRIYHKFNSGTTSGNEVADGAHYVEIDGVVYLNATGLFNRHYSNLPIDKIGFFNHAQSNDAVFEVWYDDIKISSGGFMS